MQTGKNFFPFGRQGRGTGRADIETDVILFQRYMNLTQ